MKFALGSSWKIGERVEIVLHYHGPLPAGKSHQTEVKNRLRMAFHPQLHAFCNGHFLYQPALRQNLPRATLKGGRVELPNSIPDGFFYVSVGNYEFVPLVSRMSKLVAEIRVELYRREEPGNIFTPGGDLDNRLRVIFDGVRIPQNSEEVKGLRGSQESRMFCVLEDDSLIRKVAINTRPLFTPLQVGEKETDVRLVVHMDIFSRYA